MKKIKNKLFILTLFLAIIGVQIFVVAKQTKGQLEGIHFVVDCGHGGLDMGASSAGVAEAPLNLIIGQRLKNLLESYGATVQLTRSDEKDLASPSATHRKREDIKKRVEMINQEGNDFFISVHMNKFTSESPQGAQVFYNSLNKTSEVMAIAVQQALNKCTKENKSVKKGDFLLLNEAKTPGILVECGFLSNPTDRYRLQQSSYQSQLVEAIVEGVFRMITSINYI